MIKSFGKYLHTKEVNPIFFILVGVLARLIPHVPNFTPVGALALFGGAYLNKKQSYLIPLIIMIISDFFIGFDSLFIRISVYTSFLLIVAIGQYVKGDISPRKLVFASLSASTIFFFVTNFAVWMFGTMYPKTAEGLLSCYTLAIPFFRYTLLGDIFYSITLFGIYEALRHRSILRELIIGKKSVMKL